MTVLSHRSATGETPMTAERIVTVHAGSDLSLQLALLDAIDQTLREHGVRRTWIDPCSAQDLVVMAETGDPAT